MLAKDLISDTLPHLSLKDTGLDALNWMEVFKVSHLPVVNQIELLGLISDSDIYNKDLADQTFDSQDIKFLDPYVYEDQHILEVIAAISHYNLSLIPVLDRENNYLGSITLQTLLQEFSRLTAADNPGGIIVLEMHLHDYALSEIAQIVESNDAKILSLYVDSLPDSMRLKVTLKINTVEIESIVQTFERYGYTIKATYNENKAIDSIYKSRFELFMNYLNI